MAFMNGDHLAFARDSIGPTTQKLTGSDKTRYSIAKLTAQIEIRKEQVAQLSTGEKRGTHSNRMCWKIEELIEKDQKELEELHIKLEKQILEEESKLEERFWASKEGFEDELERRKLERNENGGIRARF